MPTLINTLTADGTDVTLNGFETLQEQTPYANAADKEGLTDNLVKFLSNFIGFLTVLAALFFIVYTFIAAINWVTAGGDSGKVESARNKMIQGTMGLIVIIAAYGIVALIGTIIGLNILDIKPLILNKLDPSV